MKFVTPDNLIDAFLAGKTSMRTWTTRKPGPLRIVNDKIISFETVICERFGDFYIVNPQVLFQANRNCAKYPFGSDPERKANTD